MNVLFDFFILGYLSESSIAKDNRSTEGIQGTTRKNSGVVTVSG